MDNNDEIYIIFNDKGLLIGDLLLGHDGRLYNNKGEPIKLREPDFVDVVRCRDCEYAYELCNGMYDCQGELVEIWDYNWDCPKQNPVPPDGFCAWGKRKG